MGPTLEETRRDLRYMPTQYLTQVAQSPVDRVIGDIPLKTLAGLELSRRAQMQSEMAGMNAPNAQMPTVLDSTVQSLMPRPQQPMPQQGMAPPAPPPQQAAPQPQPQPPQPQQQQQPPQAKQPPIMGLPSMQTPKKMAGGGIIAFANEGAVPPAEEEATSTVGDALRKALQWFQDVGDPSKNPREIEARDIERANRIKPGPFEAVTPFERTRREGESAQILKAVKDKQTPPVKAEPTKTEVGKELAIQNVPEQGGLAAIMQALGGAGTRGGGGLSKEESGTRQRLLADLDKVGPAQTEYTQNASRLANQLENFKSSHLSAADRDAFLRKEFEQNQAYSKPHFDMMQKLIDEERAANNAGKESEVYKMLGKMGGALMSSRGAFGPALGRAVGEGIDYNDKVEAARAAAERLRRQAQMDLIKARMANEKGDRQSAQTLLADRERNLQAADKIEIDAKVGAMNLRKGSAELEAADQRGRERVLNQLAVSDARNEGRAALAGANQQLGLMRLAMQMQGMQNKNLPTMAERIAADKRAEEVFSTPNSPVVNKFVAMVPGGANILKSIEMGVMKPNDPKYMQAIQAAQELYKQSLSQGTRTSGGSPGITMGTDYAARIGAQ